MALGSWAIVQMQEQADKPPDDIGYMPFPHQVDGTFYSTAAGTTRSPSTSTPRTSTPPGRGSTGSSTSPATPSRQGGIPPRLDGEFPSQLADFDAIGVELLELSPQPAGEEGLTNRIDNEAEIGLFDPIYRQRIVDAARGPGRRVDRRHLRRPELALGRRPDRLGVTD